MIIYFSATGNSQYVAERIAYAINGRTLSITSCMKEKQYRLELEENEILGIISPTYSWGLPVIVKEFLEKMKLNTIPSYLWFTATYGTTSGQVGYFANEILQKKQYTFSAYFSVKMPDTWTPTYNLSNHKHIERINKKAEKEIDFLIDKINYRTTGDFMRKKIPVPIAKLFYRIEYNTMRKTRHFHVEHTCIGCGLCAKQCPISAIDITNKQPAWNQEQCVMCLSCLHHCPKFAIQYGKRTKKHGQYVHFPLSVKENKV